MELRVACPFCGAEPHQPCSTRSGRDHPSRIRALVSSAQCACRGECGTIHGYGNRSDRCPQNEGERIRGRRPVVGTQVISVVELVDGRCQLCAFAVRRLESSRRETIADASMKPGLFERE